MDYLQYSTLSPFNFIPEVLNLIINGLPSIPNGKTRRLRTNYYSFKPYYKWITFNTQDLEMIQMVKYCVLNLIINGLPSILIYILG